MSQDPGLVKQPTPAPGASEYANMVAAVGNQKADAWKAEQTQAMFDAGAKPSTVLGYWGDDKDPQATGNPGTPDESPIARQVRQNLQRFAGGADGSKVAANPMDAIAAGWDHSVSGLMQHQGRQPTVMPAHAGFVNSVMSGVGQMAGDAPYMVAGFVGGAAAGAAVPGAGETGVSEVIGGGFGAGALPQGMREVILDAHQFHPGMTAKDVAIIAGKSTLNTLKEGTTSALSMLVGGKAAQPFVKAGLSPLVSGGVNVTAQAATGATVHAAMDGKIPDGKDFAAATVLGLGLHATGSVVIGSHGSPVEAPADQSAGHIDHTGNLVLSTEGERYTKNVQEAYRQTGAMPHEVAAAAERDPVLKDELVAQDHNGNPNLAKHYALSANAPEPYQPRSKADLLASTAAVPVAGAPLVTSIAARDVIPHIEGGVGPKGEPLISPKGAVGKFQIMPGTARQYMGKDFDVSTLMDPKVNEAVFHHIMTDLERRFPGDPEAQLVAYNAGPGRVGDYVKSGPGTRLVAIADKRMANGYRYESEQTDRSERGLPEETQKYLANARAKGLTGTSAVKLPDQPEFHDVEETMKTLAEEQQARIAEARSKGPTADDLLNDNHEPSPEGLEHLEQGKAQSASAASTWEKASSDDLDAEVLSNIGDSPTPGGLTLEGVKERWFSELTPARNLDTRLMKAGLYDRDTEFGFEDAGRATYAANSRAAHMWNHGVLKADTLEKVDDASAISAFKQVKAAGGNADGFLAYLLSKRAVQKEIQGVDTGFNTLAAKEKISRPEEQKKYEEANGTWNKMTDGFLDYMRDKGFYSDEQVQAMKNSNSSAYVSFRKVIGDPGARMAHPQGRFSVSDPLRRMVGSDGQVRDPIMATLDNMRLGIQMADRNAARLHFVDRALADPEVATALGVRQVAKFDVNEDQIDEALRAYGASEAELPNLRTAYGPLVEERIASGLAENTMTIRRNGNLEVYQIDDPAYARMLKFADTPQEVNAITSMLTGFARMARTGIVSMPDFALRMTGWHQLNQFIMDPHSPPPFITWARGAVEAFGGGKLYQDALAKGAIVDNFADLEKDTVARDLDSIYETTDLKKRLWNTTQSILHATEWVSQRLSAANRIGLYEHYQSKGVDPLKAAMLARKAGIDYAERGTSQTLAQFSRWAPFLRPKFLGMKQGFEALGDHPALTLSKAALIVAGPTLILRALNWMHDQSLPDDRKDLDGIDAVPRYIRYGHYVTPPIMGQRIFIRHPANFGLPFGGFLERTLDAMQKHDPHAFDDFMQDVLREYVPPLSASPAMVTPAIEALSNHDFNTGRPLVSDTMMKMSGPSQFNDNTTAPAKALAKIINPAWSSMTATQASPIAIQHLVQGWGGPTAMAAMQALNAPFKQPGPPSEISDMPFFKSFMVRNPRTNSQQIEDFYEDYDKFGRAHADLTAAINRLSSGQSTPEDVAQAMANPAAGAAQSGAGIVKALSNMRVVAKAIEADKDMTPTEKSQHLDTIYAEMIQFAKLGSSTMRTLSEAK